MGDRLRYEEVIPSETLDYLVPALLLQPLVENAIRHGIEASVKPGLVRVVVQPQEWLARRLDADSRKSKWRPFTKDTARREQPGGSTGCSRLPTSALDLSVTRA